MDNFMAEYNLRVIISWYKNLIMNKNTWNICSQPFYTLFKLNILKELIAQFELSHKIFYYYVI